MCALGQKGGISEAATILYSTANVLVCIDVMTLAGLHNAIKRYCENSRNHLRNHSQISPRALQTTKIRLAEQH